MKKVLVTGATRGLGLAITTKLVNEGYHVIASGRKMSEPLERLMGESCNEGKVTFYSYDFTNIEGIKPFVSKIVKEHGRPYGLINNAALGHDGVLGTMHESQIIELINVNVAAPIILTKYVSRAMLVEQTGRIINISSIIGSTGFNGLSVYGATKSSLLGFTKSLSRELGKCGITVNAVAPGYMQTDMTSSLTGEKLDSVKRRSSIGRLATTEEVAAAVLFLLSDDAAAINGTTITVDAGSTA